MCGGPFRAEEEEHVKGPSSHGPLCMNASASYLSLQFQPSQSPLTRSHYPPGMFFLSSVVTRLSQAFDLQNIESQKLLHLAREGKWIKYYKM